MSNLAPLPRARRRLAVAAVGIVGIVATLVALTTPAGAQTAPAGQAPVADSHDGPSAVPPPSVLGIAGTARVAGSATTMAFVGRGWGHGRGLSQYGSQGYATKFAWTTAQILDHYYGGTHAGLVSQAVDLPVDPHNIRIRLIAQDAQPTVVQVATGRLAISDAGPVADPGDLTAVRLTAEAGGTLRVERAPTCAGPWTPVGVDGRSTKSAITVSVPSGPEQLQLCRADGAVYWYPGTLQATVISGVQRTVNTTSIEAQLRSVVPRESPASWHANALGAQAVSARSYALAGDTRHRPYADTCDTTLCQVYAGHARQLPGGTKEATTDPRTDAAISATAGQIRLTSSNRLARTEFASTSGGWTAGGTFPAVEDKGDVISPLHTWSRTVEVTRLEESYGKGGTLVDVEVLDRNGLGADGGRVVTARVTFSNDETVVLSGNTIRSRAGLLSDWFTPTCPVVSRYLESVFQLFLGRSASGAEVEEWCPRIRRGERGALTSALSVSDEWAGVQIEGLYTEILGRPSESGGRAFWLGQVRAGHLVEDIAAEFYGSEEYFRRSAGRTNAGYVDALYEDLLGRPADDAGRNHWVKLLDRGARSRVGVAEEFYASAESRSDRVAALYRQILGRGPDRAGQDYWAARLPTLGDVALAASLSASDEYYGRATAPAES